MKMSHPGNCMQVHREFTAGMPKHACTCFLELITLLGGQRPLHKWIFSSSGNRSKVSFCASILIDLCSTQYCVLKRKTHSSGLLRPHMEWCFSVDVLSISKDLLGSELRPSRLTWIPSCTSLCSLRNNRTLIGEISTPFWGLQKSFRLMVIQPFWLE